MSITWEDFAKVDMRVGTIVRVMDFPEARKPAYQLVIDFGESLGQLQSSAQITVHYKKEDLLQRQVIAVVNFEPKKIAHYTSDCLVLGIYDEHKDVVLLAPGKKIANGMKIG